MFGLENYIANEYLRAFVILVVGFFIIRVGLFFVQKIVLKLTSKTKTDLDDKLVQKSSSPLTIAAFLIVLRITLGELNLSEQTNMILINLIYSGLMLVIAHLAYIILDLMLIRILSRIASKTKTRVDESIISLFDSVVKVSLIAISILYIMTIWGFEIGPLLAGLGIAGLAIALALQPVLANIFSGASMIFDRSIGVGDLVYLDNQSIKGKIVKVGLRSTKLKTFDNELIIIPNTQLAESTIQNVALPEPKTRAVVPFGVAYGSEIDNVKKLVMGEIKKVKNVLDDPEPVIRFNEMADSSLNFSAYFYVDSFENRAEAIDEANTRIYNILNKNKIEIPFPQMDVNLNKK
ncbi:mechanosensitive ion channel family protein [archaeon]|jgi:MscS family membrane protein|nr:mechanosensitive ion channel family protein [archaeon]MBT4241321.1 mechanosensitive ion channel family protein [archaeon]MBT4418142.1 mechanosensitive ion channel family protein [archaeon]